MLTLGLNYCSEEQIETDDKKSEKQDDDTGSVSSEMTSEETESVWRPGAVSEFKLMMNEEEFNIKLVELKQGVSLTTENYWFSLHSSLANRPLH